MKLFLKKYLSDREMAAIASKIAEVEDRTSGEVRVSILRRRPRGEKALPLHEVALREFIRLGMDSTRDRTGVLVLLLLSERRFHIIADEGIHKKVEEGTWGRIAETMTRHFKEGKFAEGISAAIEAVGKELQRHFPLKPDDRNELPDDVAGR